jgi:DGQHR domain-containing protein
MATPIVSPRAASKVRKTPNFDFIFGRYDHSTVPIPYFQVSMSFADVKSYLTLVSEMPGASSVNWKIEELFQRDIDWGRVQNRIVPYLKQRDQPHFFNSLTIALLPFRGAQVQDFEQTDWNPPGLESPNNFSNGRMVDYGPISCGYWQSWNTPNDDGARLGQLAWNTSEICAVAIDGQHRLAAIKELQDPGVNSTVPVILVVLHPLLGFAVRGRSPVIDTLRRLFIDLNKHAQKVSRARQILLDDRDPASICVRALIGTELTTGVHELDSTPPKLPLSLIDWHSEQAKFDEGPYLTTILGTDWAVATVLGIKPFEDPMAHDEIESLIGKLESQLGIVLDSARARLLDDRRFERPFGFVDSDDELGAIAIGFQRHWSRALVQLFTGLSPYKTLIELRKSLDTLNPGFANWFALKEGAEEAGSGTRASELLSKFEHELSSRPQNPMSPVDLSDAVKQCEDHKRGHQLAFTVVFQKALVFAYRQFTKVSRKMLDDLGEAEEFDVETAVEEAFDSGDDDELVERAQDLIAALNALIERAPEILSIDCQFALRSDGKDVDRLWLCSFAQPEGPIDFTQSASKRASDFLLLIALLWQYRTVEGLGKKDFDKLIERVELAEGGLDLKLSQCLSRMFTGDQSVGARILTSRDQKPDQDEQRDQIVRRARWLWNILSR